MIGDALGVASAISRFDPSTGNVADDLLPPVPARKVPQLSMLRCPPPAATRIAQLNALQTPPMPPLDIEEGPRISLVGVGPIAMRPRYRWPGSVVLTQSVEDDATRPACAALPFARISRP